jgi:hypothetical protein
MADAERPIGSGLAAPLIMSGESDGGSPQRSNNNRAYPQAVGTPPRVGPPGQQVSRSPGGPPMATTISPKLLDHLRRVADE